MDDCIPYTGEQFNNFYGCLKFIKITSNNELENYTYNLKNGLNEISFAEHYGSVSGGIKFYEADNLFQQIDNTYSATYIRYLTIPEDANVIVKKDHYLSDKVILHERQTIAGQALWQNPELYRDALLQFPKLAKYAQHIPLDLANILVKKNPEIIEFIDNPTEYICIEVVTNRPYLIKNIKNPTINVYKAALDKSPYTINHIMPIPTNIMLELIDYKPEIIKLCNTLSEDIKEILLQKDGLLIEHITPKTSKICDIALNNNIEAIRYIPDNFKTYDVCLKAVKHNKELFKCVPQKFMDDVMCLDILKQDPTMIKSIINPTNAMYLVCSATMPELLGKITDPSLIKHVDPLEIIKSNPHHIKNITDPTYELCYEAVKKVGILIQFVPTNMHDKQLCVAAVTNDGLALKYIENQTKEICMLALKNKPISYKHIKNRTNELYEYLLELDCTFIKEIQYYIKDDEDFLDKMQLYCVRKNGLLLKYLINPSYEMCLDAIKDNIEALEYIPNNLLTDNLLKYALSLNGLALKCVKQQTEIMCINAVNNNAMAIKYVDNEFLTEELCITAIKSNYKAFGEIINPSFELCLMAVKINPKTINYIKDLNLNKCFCLCAMNCKIIPYIKNNHLKNACIQIEQQFIDVL